MPLGELSTGSANLCASSVSSLPPSESVTPWPMKTAGRRAARIMSAERLMSSGAAPLRRLLKPSQTGSRVTSASSWKRLKGMSTLTGPGRPLVIVVTAWRRASGSMSTREGWKLRFTTGRTTFGKSAWLWRLSSWNGLRLNCEVGTLAVRAKNAEESVWATASAITRLADPGPQEVSVAAGRCLTRK